MSDIYDNDVLFALMSAVSATTLITLVADADATKHKRRPRRKHRVERLKTREWKTQESEKYGKRRFKKCVSEH